MELPLRAARMEAARKRAKMVMLAMTLAYHPTESGHSAAGLGEVDSPEEGR
jgi:hypothetical protein